MRVGICGADSKEIRATEQRIFGDKPVPFGGLQASLRCMCQYFVVDNPRCCSSPALRTGPRARPAQPARGNGKVALPAQRSAAPIAGADNVVLVAVVPPAHGPIRYGHGIASASTNHTAVLLGADVAPDSSGECFREDMRFPTKQLIFRRSLGAPGHPLAGKADAASGGHRARQWL